MSSDTPTGQSSTQNPEPGNAYDAHRAAMTTVLGLGHLPDAWQASVTGYLVMAAAAADLFLAFPLDETYDELAPVFTPDAVTSEPDRGSGNP
jgi:hypothetical protein